MSKIHRGGRSAEGEPLSAGRVEYLEAARARARAKHIRRTVIIVAQRISTVLDADQIVVLKDGEVVGLGTHGELMETCEVYRAIAESQMKGGE